MKKFLLLIFSSVFLLSCSQDEELIDLNSVNKTDNNEKNKIEICHYDKDSGEYFTINVSENALEAHLAHGDAYGNCDDSIVICKDGETIRVNKYELESYEPFDLGDCESGQVPGLEYTYVPDDNFETALIDLGLDNEDDGLDNLVLTSNINRVTFLDVNNRGIKDLTGIEGFSRLTFLRCYDNELTNLDVSKNLVLDRLYCYRNNLIGLDLSQNTSLVIVLCQGNNLTSLNVNNGNNLDEDGNTILKKVDSRFNDLEFIKVDSPSDANNGLAPYNGWLKDASTLYN
jgi:hypothetical protein